MAGTVARIVATLIGTALLGAVSANRAQPDSSDAPLTNILVNSPPADATENDTQSTTELLRSADNVMVAAFTDSGSGVGGVHQRTGWARSTDNGATPLDMGTLPSSTAGDGGLPRLARSDTTGRIFLTTTTWSARYSCPTGVFSCSPGPGGPSIQVFRSDDNGLSFQAPINGMPGFGAQDLFDDFYGIAIDNFPGPGQGNVYLAVRTFSRGGAGSRPDGIYVTRSSDGGNTGGPAVAFK